MRRIFVTYKHTLAQVVGGGVVGIVHLQVRIHLFVGIQLLLQPRLMAPAPLLKTGVGLDDAIHLHVVGIKQEVYHRTTVIGLGIGQYDDTWPLRL